ncbi:23S ribosomal RNA methyltransferase Erm [Nesterenkonia aerolata]|uniref:23S ribosomal RNA methyltransferase Erm n=1 Tax=Nesterenkonia aerolata TaxID=3074079 RepID=A0ABU2DSE1_9MICC|nr:23S ribosomal RNA methyltransferase Erm [Nesterenkonia sp. LY-0111]MDR8019403.1 23S ribosomal RNA methyltransferase Erm [Nesterenkonia sp. LY-0111]
MRTYTDGRHEHGQNFLTDRRVIRQIVDLVAKTSGALLEIGPGKGALTLPLEKLNRPLTAVEIHPGLAQHLASRTSPTTQVVTGDFLEYRLPQKPFVVVGNLPFHLTTSILRKLLHHPHWTQAVLITQWEVARRRAGVGGASMMTAQWAPFYTFDLAGRVPARAYTPAPSVDGGIITITRRATPLLPWKERKQYAGFVHQIFTGPGRGIGQILRNATGGNQTQVGQWLGELGIKKTTLPKDLTAEQWAGIYHRSRGTSRRTGSQLGKVERAGPRPKRRQRKRPPRR